MSVNSSFEQAAVADTLKNLSSLAHGIHDYSRQIQLLPYDPELWLCRSNLLREAGFPELAIGDGYKAKLLLDAFETLDPDTRLGDSALLSWGMRKWIEDQCVPELQQVWSNPDLLTRRLVSLRQSLELQMFKILADGLYLGSCYWDSLTVAKAGLEKHPGDEDIESLIEDAREMMNQKFQLDRPSGISDSENRSTLRCGQVAVVQYPWQKSSERDSRLMSSLARRLRAKTTKCELRRRSTSQQHDSYGIFATGHLKANSKILTASPVVSASSSPLSCPVCAIGLEDTQTGKLASDTSKLPCCNTAFCSEKCASTALSTFHPPLCKADLPYLSAPSSQLLTNDYLAQLTLSKLYAEMIQLNESNPLTSASVGYLQPHHGSGCVTISLETTFVLPIKTLTALGVDVFADQSFDTWILHTVDCRLINNARLIEFRNPAGKAEVSVLNEFQALFNHSCEPNLIQATPSQDRSTVVYSARTNITDGEELCYSYLDNEKFFAAGLEERQVMLRPWFENLCWCTRCKRERIS